MNKLNSNPHEQLCFLVCAFLCFIQIVLGCSCRRFIYRLRIRLSCVYWERLVSYKYVFVFFRWWCHVYYVLLVGQVIQLFKKFLISRLWAHRQNPLLAFQDIHTLLQIYLRLLLKGRFCGHGRSLSSRQILLDGRFSLEEVSLDVVDMFEFFLSHLVLFVCA